VRLSSPDIPSLSFHAESVVVDLSSITVNGGTATINTDFRTFTREVAQWRGKRPTGSGTSSSGKRTVVSVRGLALSWPNIDGTGTRLSVAGVDCDDALQSRAVEIGSLELRHPLGSVSGESVRISITHEQPTRVQSLVAKHLRAELRLDGIRVARDVAPDEQPSDPSSSTDPRAAVTRWASLAWSPMAPGGEVQVDAFDVLAHHRAEQINIGPGVLSVRQADNVIAVGLVPRVDEGKVGITFRGAVPMGTGDVVFDVVGGPISLATLGVKDGNLGLVNVHEVVLSSDAHLTLHGDGSGLSVDGTFVAKNVGVSHPKVAPVPVLGLEVSAKVRGKASLDRRRVFLDDAQIDIGKVQFQLRGTIDRTQDRLRVDVHFGIPLVACQSFLDALPENLAPVVHGMNAAGTLSLDGQLRWDEANAKDFRFSYEADNDCRFTSVPSAVDVRRFRSAFTRTAFDAKGRPVEVETGPGTASWSSWGEFNNFIVAGVMTCEDGRFRRHRGFDHEAINNSVRENLREKKFVRGASTISMQLAKNLYLGREKTVSRKLQELILTTYLEQVLTKDQILELYLNIVELGPMTFGVGDASRLYFRKPPSSLTLSQAMYLASILPSPNRQHFGKDGKVTERWMRYLYTLMRKAAKMRWVDDYDLERGLAEWAVQGSSDPIRLTPGLDGRDGDQSSYLESDDPFGWIDPQAERR